VGGESGLQEAVGDRRERRPHQATEPEHDQRDGQVGDAGQGDRAQRPQADDRDEQVALRQVAQLVGQRGTGGRAGPQGRPQQAEPGRPGVQVTPHVQRQRDLDRHVQQVEEEHHDQQPGGRRPAAQDRPAGRGTPPILPDRSRPGPDHAQHGGEQQQRGARVGEQGRAGTRGHHHDPADHRPEHVQREVAVEAEQPVDREPVALPRQRRGQHPPAARPDHPARRAGQQPAGQHRQREPARDGQRAEQAERHRTQYAVGHQQGPRRQPQPAKPDRQRDDRGEHERRRRHHPDGQRRRHAAVDAQGLRRQGDHQHAGADVREQVTGQQPGQPPVAKHLPIRPVSARPSTHPSPGAASVSSGGRKVL
jgi:hypothetical protein